MSKSAKTKCCNAQKGIYFDIGSMNVECCHYNALHWIYERVMSSSK